jgi:hypothetical protein
MFYRILFTDSPLESSSSISCPLMLKKKHKLKRGI